MQTSIRLSSDCTAHFTERSFWHKVRATSCKVGEDLLTRVVALYYALQDADTPRWARGVILSALGYFILPLDAVASDAHAEARRTRGSKVMVAAGAESK